MSTGAPSYTIRPFQAGDREAILALLDRSLGRGPTGRRTPELFAWKHEENPFGRSFALVAELDGQVAGFRTFMHWRFRTSAGPIAAVRAVDTATHPDHQGRGIFTKLTLTALDRLSGSAQLVFNTPNAHSLPGYLKMGWSVVGRVPIALRPVRPLRFVRAVVATRGAVGGEPAGPPPSTPLLPVADVLADGARVAALLDSAGSPPDRLATDRSVAYLRWRYAAAPGFGYRAIALERGNELRGLLVARARRRGQLEELTVAELIVRTGDRSAARRLLGAAARAGSDHVAVHLPDGGARRAGWRSGYLTAPRGMTLVARPLAAIDPDPLRLGSWHFALGDLEVF